MARVTHLIRAYLNQPSLADSYDDNSEKIQAFHAALAEHLREEQIRPGIYHNYIQTAKGKCTLRLEDVYGGTKLPTINIHWLSAIDRGAGRSALEIIAPLADQYGIVLTLEAAPLSSSQSGFKISREQLVKFYQSFGFKQTKVTTAGYPYMTRRPKPKKKQRLA